MSEKTRKAFLDDAYLTACEGKVVAINERGGIILDSTNFYATSGGQPGDSGHLERADGSRIAIATTKMETHWYSFFKKARAPFWISATMSWEKTMPTAASPWPTNRAGAAPKAALQSWIDSAL